MTDQESNPVKDAASRATGGGADRAPYQPEGAKGRPGVCATVGLVLLCVALSVSAAKNSKWCELTVGEQKVLIADRNSVAILRNITPHPGYGNHEWGVVDVVIKGLPNQQLWKVDDKATVPKGNFVLGTEGTVGAFTFRVEIQEIE